jgi:hypothetical protein
MTLERCAELSTGNSPSKPGNMRTAKSHTVRSADGCRVSLPNLSRKLAIFAMCCECLGWEEHPDLCTATLCPLFPFRGKTLKTRKGDLPRLKGHELSFVAVEEHSEGEEPREQLGGLNGTENTTLDPSGRKEQP